MSNLITTKFGLASSRGCTPNMSWLPSAFFITLHCVGLVTAMIACLKGTNSALVTTLRNEFPFTTVVVVLYA